MSTHGGVDEEVNCDNTDGTDKDSGGPGIYSQLLIIKEYMVRLANDRGIGEGDVYPADYFDLMGGVGFGGLVAILLGHLRMNVDEAIEALLDVALAIFSGDPPNSDPEIRTKQLRESVENVLRSREVPLDQKMQETSAKAVGCKVALYAATTADLSHPVVLRTYKPRGSSLNPTIVEAICATMVIPPYFSPIKCGPRGRHQVFIGGPNGANNPTRELLKEASAVFGKEKLVSQIVSLGSGRSHISSMERNTNIEGISRLVQEMAADCNAVAKELSTRLCDMDAYLRLNVDRAMENLRMNEWGNLGPVEIHTNAYVETPEISERLDASLRRMQGSVGTVTLGEINHPRAANDVQATLDKQKNDLDRALTVVKDNEDFRLLDRLNPVNALSYYEDRSCMKDTRKLILDHLVTWATVPSEDKPRSKGYRPKNMFWLYGSPGLGKTAVANTLCHRLHMTGNLGGSFFCRRDDPVACDPNRVLPTLLHRLSCMWRPYRDIVVQVLRGDPNLNPDGTGCALLLRHLYSLQNRPNTPLVLVVDALDESGDPRTRAPLLRCFWEIGDSVDWLKIIVTSRPEHDISDFFQKRGLIGHDLSEDDQAHEDIRTFARYRMDSLAKQYHLHSDWPGQSRLEQIVRRSGGLFIFVETLYQFLDDPDPDLLLTQVLGGTLQGANAELHKLYSTAIETRIGRNKEHFRFFVQSLVATAARRSLPDKTLAVLIGLEPRIISSWVDNLSSLLYRDVSENGGIRARHLSVIEFFTDPICPLEFRVDVQEANGRLAHRCLITMTKDLEFNICKLETSCVLNADIPNLEERVQGRISDALQYSSIHWSSHLCSGSSPASEVLDLLSAFLRGAQLLYWLEVLSLMGKVPEAILALRLIKACSKQFEVRRQIPVEDALRFVLAFFTLISTSAPHIYISGLPFMPVECSLWKHASLSFPELINVYEGRMESWPAPSGVWNAHTKVVNSVSYSPDGQYVASDSDNTIRIWDAETGAAVGEPLKGHIGLILSVYYSPNGQNIVSGFSDNTVRIWDVQTGSAVGGPLRGHTGWVSSVAYSPDGQRIVSGSYDKTIRIWDADTGAAVKEPLKGLTGLVFSVAYSPSGQTIISGSNDNTIRIWDTKMGAAVGEPLKGHTDYIRSVAYSPDGRNIVSGSSDNTIRFWDVETGAAIRKPLKGHTRPVSSVAYSPDGRNIISGSEDGTIRIWDAHTGAAVGEPQEGHTDYIRSVAYSPDGRNIVSGSSDGTIRIWDVQTEIVVEEHLERSIDWIRSVRYSPDGRNIVSCSYGNTIRIWNTQTGAAVGEPLKGHTSWVSSVAYSPDGRTIVSGSEDNTIRTWDAETGAAVGRRLKGHTDYVQSVAYSPDGRNIVSGSYDETIQRWDVKTHAAVGEPLKGHTGPVSSVAYSPDGRNIISGSNDSTIRIWDARAGEAVRGPLRGHTKSVCSVAYSPDGRNIISGSGDSTIRIWNAQTGAAVGEPLTEHTHWVQSVAYSPDGRNIISGSRDGTIRIWDVKTREVVGDPLKGHNKSVWSVAYSPNGRNVVSCSHDNTIRIWEAQKSVEDVRRVSSALKLFNDYSHLSAFSGLPIPTALIDSNGWIHGTEGPLLWVPEDCRHGVTCHALMTIPNTGRQRRVRIDFSRFQYGTSWTKIRGNGVEGQLE